jgi:cytochrome c oxidase assembly protein subunit 15
MGHFVLSLALVSCALVLHERAAWPDTADEARPGWAVPAARRPAVGPGLVKAGRWLLVAGGVVVVTGTMVTGSGPHGGDPSADRLPIELLIAVRVHAVSSIVFLAGVLGVLARLGRRAAPAAVQRAGTVLLGVIVGQGLVGYVQYFTGVPPLLVGLHVLGATLVWLALVHLQLRLSRPAPVVVPAPAPLAVATG